MYMYRCDMCVMYEYVQVLVCVVYLCAGAHAYVT